MPAYCVYLPDPPCSIVRPRCAWRPPPPFLLFAAAGSPQAVCPWRPVLVSAYNKELTESCFFFLQELLYMHAHARVPSSWLNQVFFTLSSPRVRDRVRVRRVRVRIRVKVTVARKPPPPLRSPLPKDGQYQRLQTRARESNRKPSTASNSSSSCSSEQRMEIPMKSATK